MSTRSRIAVKREDETFRSVYCHFDGYPAGVGATLAAHYTDPAKVERLIGLGDLSSLGPEIGERHPFDDRSEATAGWCLAYGRDRNEDGTASAASADFNTLAALTEGCGGEYLYVFADGTWRCYDAKGRPIAAEPPAHSPPPEETAP
ncbi:MAG: hypothetical protein ACYDBB_04660 [Armatimonadota bacterium]